MKNYRRKDRNNNNKNFDNNNIDVVKNNNELDKHNKNLNKNGIKALIFDWAGTTVDYGCFAPVKVFVQVFKELGIDVTMEEARIPMGLLKWDHIKEMLKMERIGREFENKFHRKFNDEDVDKLYAMFEPKLIESLSEYTKPIPYVIDVVNKLKEKGIKIGSTTGYTDSMMEIVVKGAKEKGYCPDSVFTPDSTNKKGRPYPFMIYRNMEELEIDNPKFVLRVGDTVADIKEGLNSGAWSCGVIIGSSEMGYSIEEFEALSEDMKKIEIERVRKKFIENGAHYTINDFRELPNLIDNINNTL